jgi:hypothetical protein
MTTLLITRDWYSSGLGGRVPAVTISARSRCASGMVLVTRPGFAGSVNSPGSANFAQAVKWGTAGADSARRAETQGGG